MIAYVPPPRRRIYLMRHGSVSYFDDDGRPLGSDQVPLNETGREQARQAGVLFRRFEVSFDRVITSTLPRTIETAELVLEHAGQSIPVEHWPDLVEIRGGNLESIHDDGLREAFLGALSGTPAEQTRYLGGESVGELLDRVYPAIDRLRADPGWHNVLMVLHGGVNRAILSYALTGQRMMIAGLLQMPACINALDVGDAPRDWIVRYVNLFAADLLQRDARAHTVEHMLALYTNYRRSRV